MARKRVKRNKEDFTQKTLTQRLIRALDERMGRTPEGVGVVTGLPYDQGSGPVDVPYDQGLVGAAKGIGHEVGRGLSGARVALARAVMGSSEEDRAVAAEGQRLDARLQRLRAERASMDLPDMTVTAKAPDTSTGVFLGGGRVNDMSMDEYHQASQTAQGEMQRRMSDYERSQLGLPALPRFPGQQQYVKSLEGMSERGRQQWLNENDKLLANSAKAGSAIAPSASNVKFAQDPALQREMNRRVQMGYRRQPQESPRAPMEAPNGAPAQPVGPTQAKNAGKEMVTAADKLFKDKPLSRQAYERAMEYWNKNEGVDVGREKQQGLFDARAKNTRDTVGKYAERKQAMQLEKALKLKPKVPQGLTKGERELHIAREKIKSKEFQVVLEELNKAQMNIDPKGAKRLTQAGADLTQFLAAPGKDNKELASAIAALSGGDRAMFVQKISDIQGQAELSGETLSFMQAAQELALEMKLIEDK